MEKNQHFLNFLDQIKEFDVTLVESIESAYNLLFEAKKEPAIRTRPNPVFDANDTDVNDNKDHFPLGSVNQARNALARVNQYSSVPEWYNGKSLKSMKAKVVRAVKKAYPSIEVTEKSMD